MCVCVCVCVRYIGCLNMHGTHLPDNISNNDNVRFFFCFSFENSIP